MTIGFYIVSRCKSCIKIRTRWALQLWASREEIPEAVGVAVLLLGGPTEIRSTEIIEKEIQSTK